MSLIISEMNLLLQLRSTFVIFTLSILHDQISTHWQTGIECVYSFERELTYVYLSYDWHKLYLKYLKLNVECILTSVIKV